MARSAGMMGAGVDSSGCTGQGEQKDAMGPEPLRGFGVTPVRHEHGQQDGLGQEEYGEHKCTPIR